MVPLTCHESLPVLAVKPTKALPWFRRKAPSRLSGTTKQGSCTKSMGEIVIGLEDQAQLREEARCATRDVITTCFARVFTTFGTKVVRSNW